MEIGQQSIFTNEDRRGERIPFRNRDQPEGNIPLLDINPFGSDEQRHYDSDDEEAPFNPQVPERGHETEAYHDGDDMDPIPEQQGNPDRPLHEYNLSSTDSESPEIDRFDNGTDKYNPNWSSEGEREVSDNRNESTDESDVDRLSQESDNSPFAFEGAPVDRNDDRLPTALEDAQITEELVGPVLPEDIGQDDEHNEEPTALGRKNDGVYVANVSNL